MLADGRFAGRPTGLSDFRTFIAEHSISACRRRLICYQGRLIVRCRRSTRRWKFLCHGQLLPNDIPHPTLCFIALDATPGPLCFRKSTLAMPSPPPHDSRHFHATPPISHDHDARRINTPRSARLAELQCHARSIDFCTFSAAS